MAVRVAKFEVYRIAGDLENAQATRARWHDLARQCQQITNYIWETWLVWHVGNDSANKIRGYLDALAAWRETKEGDKPKCEVFATTKELSKIIYDGLGDNFPTSHVRVRDLLSNIIKKKIRERKAASGPLSGWMAILLRNESLPSSTRSQPIPFDRANAQIIPPADPVKDNFGLRLRIDRIQNGKPIATSTLDEIELMTRRRGIQGQTAVLHRITQGDYKFCGSSLHWDKKNKKWMALICYDMQKQVEMVAGDAVAILSPAKSHPWSLRICKHKPCMGKKRRWYSGRGRAVSAVRRKLLTQRWARQEGYRVAGSSNKGHGRERATAPAFKLSRRWKDFVKTMNHTISRQIVNDCVRDDLGVLVYYQPTGDWRGSRYLSTAGKIPDRHDSTCWDWFQMGTMLAYKCEQAGIRFVLRKSGCKGKTKAA